MRASLGLFHGMPVPRPASGLSICSSEWGIPPLCCFPKKMGGLQLVSDHEKLLCSTPSSYIIIPHSRGLCRSPTILILSLSLCSEQGGRQAHVYTLHLGVGFTTCSFLLLFAPGVGLCCRCCSFSYMWQKPLTSISRSLSWGRERLFIDKAAGLRMRMGKYVFFPAP